MKQLAVLSGKGGTGKTTVVASLAQLLAPVLVVDCDVDAANLALLLPGSEEPAFSVTAGQDAAVDRERCMGCGLCVEACRFGAISLSAGCAFIEPLRCEGCNTCQLVCPAGAIQRSPRTAGVAWVRQTDFGPLVHAQLSVAQDNSGHLVTYIRNLAARIAENAKTSWVLLDGPPGLGCPVQATLAGVDGVLVVVEPSPSSVADLQRLLELLTRLSLPVGVLINKFDVVPNAHGMLAPLCLRFGVKIVGKLPYLPEVPQCLSRGEVPGQQLEAIRCGLVGVLHWLSRDMSGVGQAGGGDERASA